MIDILYNIKEFLEENYLNQILDFDGFIEVDVGSLPQDLLDGAINSPEETTRNFKRALDLILKEKSLSAVDGAEIRFFNLPDESLLRELNSDLLNKLIMIRGIVIRSSPVQPLLTSARFRCRRCNALINVPQRETFLLKPATCPTEGCTSNWFILVESESQYEDYQQLRIQERPEDLPAGQIPRWLDIDVGSGLINLARAGDLVTVIGIYEARMKSTRSSDKILKTYLKANNIIIHSKDIREIKISDEEMEKIEKIAAHPQCYQYIIQSVAPSIFGEEHIKESIMYLLFGGVSKKKKDIKIRGEINCLLIGDPGTGKTQLLRVASKLAPRGIYAVGRGSTAAGLTAAVVKTDGGWVLEAGAMTLADMGVACLEGDSKIWTVDQIITPRELWEMGHPTKHPMKRRVYFLTPSWHTSLKKRSNQLLYEVIQKPYAGELLEIRLSNGLVLRVTPDHRFYWAKRDGKYIRNLKPAEKLKVGEYLRVIPLDFPPDAVEEKHAYLFGMIYGDGYPNEEGITISQSMNNKDIIDRILAVYPEGRLYIGKSRKKQLGKYELIEHPGKVWISDKRVLVKYIKEFAHLQILLKLNKNSFSQFIGGLFDADGNINRSKGKIIALRLYPTKDDKEVEILMYGLKRLGINTTKGRYRKDIYEISITSGKDMERFWKSISPYSAKLQREATPSFKYKKFYYKHKDKWSRIDEIKSVYLDGGYVYDVNVKNTHNFIIHGVLVHNCLDEIEKMRPEDRSAIHEALSVQTISINKAGINTTLNARAGVLAAANPKYGTYDRERNLKDNIDLPSTILSRFDLIFILQDIPEGQRDDALAEHVLGLNDKEKKLDLPELTPALMRKYIACARRKNPRLTREAKLEIKKFYRDMRKASEGSNSPRAVSPRQLEAIIRLSEAHARVALKDESDIMDAEAAIKIMDRSLRDVAIDVNDGVLDVGMIEHGTPRDFKQKARILETWLREKSKNMDGVSEEEIYKWASTMGITSEEVKRIFDKNQFYLLRPKEGYYRLL